MSPAAAVLVGIVLALATAPVSAAPATRPAEPDWVPAMRKVHAAHRPGGDGVYVAQLGDSITYSMAFWSSLDWHDPDPYLPADDGLPKRPAPDKRWRDVLRGFRDKGREHGNYSGWRTGDVLKVLDKVLAEKRPAVAIVMVGTNDVAGGSVPAGYRADLEKIVDACTAAGCVPVLNTIPPRRGLQKAVEEANAVVRDVAAKRSVPLVDYHAEIVHRRPGQTWDRTLIADDGVHPTGGKAHLFTEENLSASGYALRTWANFLTVREVYFRVVAAP